MGEESKGHRRGWRWGSQDTPGGDTPDGGNTEDTEEGWVWSEHGDD